MYLSVVYFDLKGYEDCHNEIYFSFLLALNVFIRIDAPHPQQLVAVLHQIVI